MKQFSTIIAAGIILFFSSCGNNANEKNTANMPDSTSNAIPSASFKAMVVQHGVKDFNTWLAGYNGHDSVRKAFGLTDYKVGRGTDDSNMVVVVEKIDDVQKAKDLASSPELKDAMEKDGVTGSPSFTYVNVVRNDDSPIDQKQRVMVAHHVKDYGAWLKIFDGEGKSARAANGMVDRGISRGIDDPNMVYLVFAVTDMAKVKARIASPEMKKIMTDAGVDGPPTVMFYQWVN
jgi:quinol monooxygenase YgiN